MLYESDVFSNFFLPQQIPSPDDDYKDDGQASSVEMMSPRSSPTQITLFTSTTPNVPTIFATPASDHKLSVISEASESLSKVGRLM